MQKPGRRRSEILEEVLPLLLAIAIRDHLLHICILLRLDRSHSKPDQIRCCKSGVHHILVLAKDQSDHQFHYGMELLTRTRSP